MEFWNKVLEELEIQNMSRKELSFRIDVPVSRINRAIERNSMPSAIDGLKTALALNVSLDYLLDFKASAKTKKIKELSNKQLSLLTSFESLSSQKQVIILNLINELNEI